jgi:hypothetical protein
MENQTQTTKKHSIEVRVPTIEHVMVVVETARARGVEAYVDRRSSKKVILIASCQAEAEAALQAAQGVGADYERRCLHALAAVLKDHALPAPGFDEVVASADAKYAARYGQRGSSV